MSQWDAGFEGKAGIGRISKGFVEPRGLQRRELGVRLVVVVVVYLRRQIVSESDVSKSLSHDRIDEKGGRSDVARHPIAAVEVHTVGRRTGVKGIVKMGRSSATGRPQGVGRRLRVGR